MLFGCHWKSLIQSLKSSPSLESLESEPWYKYGQSLLNLVIIQVGCCWDVEDVSQLPVQQCTETRRTRYCHWTIAAAAVESLRNVRGVAPWPRPSPVSLCPPDDTLPPGLATTNPIPNSKSQPNKNNNGRVYSLFKWTWVVRFSFCKKIQ